MGKGRLYSERISKFGKERVWGRCEQFVMNPGFVMEKGERLTMSFQAVSKLIHFSCWGLGAKQREVTQVSSESL